MSEIAFTRQYLGTLDGRPVRFSRDYVQDPRRLPAQSAYILPRIANLPPKRTKLGHNAVPVSDEAGSQKKVHVILKPLRAGTSISPIVVRDVFKNTSIYDLKVLTGNQTGYESSKIKLLWDKKPLQDSKVLGDIVDASSQEDQVELGIMFVGPPTIISDTTSAHESSMSSNVMASAQPSSDSLLERDEFWNDLRKFVIQRLKDEDYGNRLTAHFRTSWARDRIGSATEA